MYMRSSIVTSKPLASIRPMMSRFMLQPPATLLHGVFRGNQGARSLSCFDDNEPQAESRNQTITLRKRARHRRAQRWGLTYQRTASRDLFRQALVFRRVDVRQSTGQHCYCTATHGEGAAMCCRVNAAGQTADDR